LIVYFLRHASAGERRADPASDEQRPLDSEGVQQCRDVGRLLAALEVEPDVIVSSPLKRAMQTASLVAKEIAYQRELELAEGMRPDAGFESFREILESHSRKDALVVVGHDPSISRFLSLLLTGGENDSAVAMKKGSVAKVELRRRRLASLHWYITPRIARALAGPVSKV
jgi:phosphohistidine phosphatase